MKRATSGWPRSMIWGVFRRMPMATWNKILIIPVLATTLTLHCVSSCPHLVAVKLRDADGSAPPDGEGGGADGLRGEGDVVRPQRHRAVLGAGRVADLPVREGLHTAKKEELFI